MGLAKICQAAKVAVDRLTMVKRARLRSAQNAAALVLLPPSKVRGLQTA